MNTIHPVAEKLNKLSDELNARFLEREELTHASLLAMLSKEHIFALGIPGTSKTLFFTTLAKAFAGARYFQCQTSKTTPVEAVEGPLDIKQFRETGDYFLKRDGFITQVELAMVDELGKASPVLGHNLLSLLNERVYNEVRDGKTIHSAPLSTMFAASNETLTDDSDQNAALADRLLYRVLVDSIQSADNFKALLTGSIDQPETTIDWADMEKAIEHEVPAVVIGDPLLEALVGLRDAFEREGISVSDRRWKWSVKALKANAFLNGRSEAHEGDIEVLKYTLWEIPQQIEKVERLCKAASNPYYEPLMKLQDALRSVEAEIDVRITREREAQADYAPEATKKLRTAHEQVQTLEMETAAEGRTPPKDVAVVKSLIDSLMDRVLLELMQQDPESAALTKRTVLYGK